MPTHTATIPPTSLCHLPMGSPGVKRNLDAGIFYLNAQTLIAPCWYSSNTEITQVIWTKHYIRLWENYIWKLDPFMPVSRPVFMWPRQLRVIFPVYQTVTADRNSPDRAVHLLYVTGLITAAGALVCVDTAHQVWTLNQDNQLNAAHCVHPSKWLGMPALYFGLLHNILRFKCLYFLPLLHPLHRLCWFKFTVEILWQSTTIV